MILGRPGGGTGIDLGHGFHQELGAQLSQTVMGDARGPLFPILAS